MKVNNYKLVKSIAETVATTLRGMITDHDESTETGDEWIVEPVCIFLKNDFAKHLKKKMQDAEMMVKPYDTLLSFFSEDNADGKLCREILITRVFRKNLMKRFWPPSLSQRLELRISKTAMATISSSHYSHTRSWKTSTRNISLSATNHSNVASIN